MLKNPSHPGELIREQVLPAFGLTAQAAADILKMPRPNLSNIMNGKASLTHAIALKVEKAFGVSAELLTGMQNNWDLARARERTDELTAGVERQLGKPQAAPHR